MYKTVSGLDVHKDSIFCCILCADGRKIQHKFGVLTEELQTLRELLESEGLKNVPWRAQVSIGYRYGGYLKAL